MRLAFGSGVEMRPPLYCMGVHPAPHIDLLSNVQVSESGKACVEQLFRALLPACLLFVRKLCTQPVPTQELSLVAAFLRLFDSLLDEFREPAGKASDDGGKKGKKGSREEDNAAEMGRPVVTSVRPDYSPQYTSTSSTRSLL
jgi:hypothetical protein